MLALQANCGPTDSVCGCVPCGASRPACGSACANLWNPGPPFRIQPFGEAASSAASARSFAAASSTSASTLHLVRASPDRDSQRSVATLYVASDSPRATVRAESAAWRDVVFRVRHFLAGIRHLVGGEKERITWMPGRPLLRARRSSRSSACGAPGTRPSRERSNLNGLRSRDSGGLGFSPWKVEPPAPACAGGQTIAARMLTLFRQHAYAPISNRSAGGYARDWAIRVWHNAPAHRRQHRAPSGAAPTRRGARADGTRSALPSVGRREPRRSLRQAWS